MTQYVALIKYGEAFSIPLSPLRAVVFRSKFYVLSCYSLLTG